MIYYSSLYSEISHFLYRFIISQEKVCDLEEKNRELTDQSRVTSLQEELIAVKLREAEANGAMKDLTHKLHNLEENWQVCRQLHHIFMQFLVLCASRSYKYMILINSTVA